MEDNKMEMVEEVMPSVEVTMDEETYLATIDQGTESNESEGAGKVIVAAVGLIAAAVVGTVAFIKTRKAKKTKKEDQADEEDDPVEKDDGKEQPEEPKKKPEIVEEELDEVTDKE